MNAGLEFMKGLSEVLHDYYQIDEQQTEPSLKKGLKHFLEARDLTEQALLAKKDGDHEKMIQLQNKAERFFEKSIELDPTLESAVKAYQSRMASLFEDE